MTKLLKTVNLGGGGGCGYIVRKQSPCLKSEPEESGTYYDMRKVVCYIETKKVVKNVANTIVITYAVLTKSYHKCPCKLTTL